MVYSPIQRPEGGAFTIPEMCEMAGITRQRLHQLWSAGKGPDRIERKIGIRHRVLIPVPSAMEFLYRRKTRNVRKEVMREFRAANRIGP